MQHHLYPDNWKQRSQACLEQANYRCEHCGMRHGSMRAGKHRHNLYFVHLHAAHIGFIHVGIHLHLGEILRDFEYGWSGQAGGPSGRTGVPPK